MLALYRSGRQADALAAYRVRAPHARRRARHRTGPRHCASWSRRSSVRTRPRPRGEDRRGRKQPEQPPSTPLAGPPRGTRRRSLPSSSRSRRHPSRVAALDPEALRHITARAFDELRGCRERHGGTVETITAAGLIAVFGLPVGPRGRCAARDAGRRRGLVLASPGSPTSSPPTLGSARAVTIGVSTGRGHHGRVDAVRSRARPASHSRAQHGSSQAGRLGETSLSTSDAAGRARCSDRGARDRRLGARVPRRRIRSSAAMGDGRPVFSLADGRPRPRAAPASRRVRAGGRRPVVPALHGARPCRGRQVTARPGVPARTSAARRSSRRGRCLPYGEGITYWPLLEAVKDAVGPRRRRLAGADARLRLAALLAERRRARHRSPSAWPR